MRRAWMTAFGNARLAGREQVQVADLPVAHGRKRQIGFVH
jgi:ATP-dependent Lon protease